MARGLLSEQAFSRVVLSRAKRERPDLHIQVTDNAMLLIEQSSGRRRVLPLVDLYQIYCQYPLERDQVIGQFLSNLVYDDPLHVVGGFEANKDRVMPQIVPPNLLAFCRQNYRELAAMDYVGGLAIAFVLDEPERYAYLHRATAEEWAVDETTLLMAAVRNLERLDQQALPYQQIGTGVRLMLAWGCFDGYDACRILLTRPLVQAAARVPGNPVIAIPHRDYLVMFGDADPAFVAEMADRVREEYESHPYPITPQFFTLKNGSLAVYDGAEKEERYVN